MIRETIGKRVVGAEKLFRWRGHEILRIEAFADAVFALAVTLLIVSLEVPRTFGELLAAMRGLLAFALSFMMLFWMWTYQFRFFRRYGLQDGITLWLNALLLFVVLCYVYPLKFLATVLSSLWVGEGVGVRTPDGSLQPVLTLAQVPHLMAIYSAGFVAVFLIFSLLYVHAYRTRHEIPLDPLEVHATREELQDCLINVGLGGLSVAFALRGEGRSWVLPVLPYWLLGPIQTVHGITMGRERRRLAAARPAE